MSENSAADSCRTVMWRLHLSSPPSVVFEFLATDQGRAKFWAESAIETDGVIDFVFPGGETWRGDVLESVADRTYRIDYYGGTITTFTLEADGDGGTELVLRDDGVAEGDVIDVEAGWVSVLMALKAAVDHGWICATTARTGRSVRSTQTTDHLMSTWVLHVDLDQFLAAVEVRRRPELRGLPVVVGGDGNPRRPRQVVATASYEAREFGVRSGMPLAQALRRCPDAVFLPSDRPAYDAASAEVMAALRTLPATVEVWGWDEAFLGVTTDDPEAFATEIKARVAAATSLSCAVGIGETRLLAKTATGFAKPGGVARLLRREWIPTMGAKPVTAIWGIGTRTAARLGELGIVTVEDLARADHEQLARSFGPTIGPHLRVLGLGGDDSPIVDEPHVARGRSKEQTFTTDVADATSIAAHVERLAREVTAEVVADGRRVTHVAVKVRTSNFVTRTKISKLPTPTIDGNDVAVMATAVLARFGELRPVRLLGVRVVLEMPPQQ